VTRSLRHSQFAVTRIICKIDRPGLTDEIPPEDAFIVTLHLGDVRHHEIWCRGRPLVARRYARGAISIVDLDDGIAFYLGDPIDTLSFYVPRSLLNDLADEDGKPRVRDLACPPGLIDPVIESIGAALLPLFDKPKQASAMLLDHLAIAVAAHLAHKFGGVLLGNELKDAGLSPFLGQRAKHFMAANFDKCVSLAMLARTCGLSPGRIANGFKTLTGHSPHRWLQQYRIERAQDLLAGSTMSVSDIAVACGFVDQDHLTQTFVKRVGITPSGWRLHQLN
jgi:AraC family transcriptional regulator